MSDLHKEKNTVGNRVLTIIGIVLCVILTPILIVNCILLIKSWTNADQVPSFGGYAPMIVLTDSMKGENADSFNGGDLIFIRVVQPEEVKVGDVISFFDPASSNSAVTSHRVIEIINEEEGIFFRTKGDHNNDEDKLPVPSEKLVGKYTGFRIAGAGRIAMFMQTTWGLIICVILPIVLLVGWDTVRRIRYQKKHEADKEALYAELAALRAEKAAKEKTAAENPDHNSTES